MASSNGNGVLVKICVAVIISIIATLFAVGLGAYNARADMIQENRIRLSVVETNMEAIQADLTIIKTDLKEALKERKQ